MFRAIEYILFPMIAVFVTFLVKAILASKRMDIKEITAELGYDIMIMSCFGIMLDSIGSYSHDINDVSIIHYAIFGFIGAFITTLGIFGVLYLDTNIYCKEEDADIKVQRRYRCLLRFGLGYVGALICFVMYGSYLEETLNSIHLIK